MVAPRDAHARHMRQALFHAARGLGRTTPNPMVGAVVVSPDGVVLGHGWHARAGEPHAEVHALEEAGAAARGATLYVTLEPCCHVGRTGPCTRRVIDDGIARVVAAMRDPNPRVAGRGFAELRAHGIEVVEGVCADDARRLNAPFLTLMQDGRPMVALKAATSLDGRVAAAPGTRTSITSDAANRRTHVLRASIDALAVGAETMLVDDPLLTARVCARVRPLVRVIFDRRLRTPPEARVFSTLADGPVIIVVASRAQAGAARAAALEAAGAIVLEAASLDAALRALVRWDVSSLLVEGGPTLQAAFVRAGLVDRVHLVIAPQALGDSGVPWLDIDTFAWSTVARSSAEARGPDIWIEADVHRDR